MKGLVFTGDRSLELMSFPDPSPGTGEVVLEIKASGLCGSDLKFYRAPKSGGLEALGLKASSGPLIAGHEPCGVVAALGRDVDPKKFKIGSRVMVHHYHGCDVCPHCRKGWTQMCIEGAEVYGANAHGAHAPYMKVPASTLVNLPDELSFSTGAAISCGTGTAYGALVRMNASARDTIAIFGQGPVGLSATQLAVAMGARVIAVDISGDRIRQAKDFGASHIVDSSQRDPVEAIRELTGGAGVPRSLDTSGAAVGRSAAVRCAAPWGTVCFVGEGGQVTIDVSPEILRKQLIIMGSWTFSTVGQADCARFIADRGLAVDDLFTERWPLDHAVAAYKLFDTQTSGKAVFDF
jgi:threonine dehydrogenase-like Zn-dependent dehydrogenase